MKNRKVLIYVAIVCLASLFLCELTHAAGSRPSITLGVILLDPAPFTHFPNTPDNRDLIDFPENLKEEVDNAMLDGYLKLGALVNRYSITDIEMSYINRFHTIFNKNSNENKNNLARAICRSTTPQVNLLVALELRSQDMSPTAPLIVKIHGFYIKDIRLRDETVFHRTRTIRVRPSAFEALEKKVNERIFCMIQEYLKTQSIQ